MSYPPDVPEDWSPQPAELRLDVTDVHVWKVPLHVTPDALAPLEAVLSEDERTRAAQFVFDRDRRRFAAARGSLREILARYISTRPRAILIGRAQSGKPCLGAEHVQHGIRFNVSHSGDFALVGVARGREVGVDIERVRPDAAVDSLAARVFSPEERLEFARVPPTERIDAFFRGWTRKEAFVKAQGVGLATPLESFTVPLAPTAEAVLVSAPGDRWSLRPLRLDPGYMGAVVSQGEEPARLSCWSFDVARGTSW